MVARTEVVGHVRAVVRKQGINRKSGRPQGLGQQEGGVGR